MVSAFKFLRQGGSASEVRTPMSHFQIMVDDIRFGVLNINPEKTIPNPQEMSWSKSMEVAELNTVGDMPKTEPTIPDGLWKLTLQFIITDETYFDACLGLDLGPHRIKSYHHEECMLLTNIKYTRKEKTKDNVSYWTLNFTKNNPG